MHSVRCRAERRGTGVEAGGTVYGCGSRVDVSAKHVVRRRAWRRVDAAAREGMVAPGLGVQEGEGETPNGMAWVAADLVGEGGATTCSRGFWAR